MIGTTINNCYEVKSELGEGGMGMVYKGIDIQTNQPVAIKHLKSAITQPEIIERFRREGEALRELNHPNIVKMLDAIEEDGQHYLVMEYVDGGDLRTQLSQNGQLPLNRLLSIALQLADSLTRAHFLNIIHRDLKPANVLISEDDTPRLTDFGVAHFVDKDRVTDTDALVGTLDYLSPEALNGKTVDNRADIWSFGVMLFEMLAGKRPFTGQTLSHTITSILTESTPDLEELCPDAPIALVDLIYRMLEKDPTARIRSVRLVGAELEAIMQGDEIDTSSVGISIDTDAFATPVPDTDAPKHNLPTQATEFVGREDELAELTKLIDDPKVRLITILGPGGMGKSRLALELSERKLADNQFSNGIWFVELAPLQSGDDIVTAIAAAAKFQFQGADRSPKQQLLDYFREKNALIIMDNCEHVLDGVGIVDEILQNSPDVQVVATSREKLNLYGETVFTLGGLEFPEWETPEDALQYNAVKLFMNSANRAAPGYELQAGDLNYLARICRLSYGMPLAIELAAAWVEMLSLQEIASEIEQSLDFLETEMRNVPERHRSIRAAFEYSWNLLQEKERAIFVKFAVFKGSFSRKAAQSITGAGLRQLTTLVNKSLLRRNADTGRYQVHEMLRQFAEEELENRNELQTIRDSHSKYYLQALRNLTDDLDRKDQPGALNSIEIDIENAHAAVFHAVERGVYDDLQDSLYNLWRYYMIREQHPLASPFFTEVVKALKTSATSEDHDKVLGAALLYKADVNIWLHQSKEAEDALQEAEVLINDVVDDRLQALLWIIQGDYQFELGDIKESRPYFMQAVELLEKLENYFMQAYVLRWLSVSFWYREMESNPDVANAKLYLEKAYTLSREQNNIRGIGDCLHTMCVIAAIERRYEDIDHLYAESRSFLQQIGKIDQPHNMAIFAMLQCQWDKARQYMRQALSVAHEIGNQRVIAWRSEISGHIEFLAGDYAQAKAYYTQAHTKYEKIGHVLGVAFGQLSLAQYAIASGHYDHASQLLQQAEETLQAQPEHQHHLLGFGHLVQGILAMYQGDHAKAHEHLNKALDISKEYGSLDGELQARGQQAWAYFHEGQLDNAHTLAVENLDALHKNQSSSRLSPSDIKGNSIFAHILLGTIAAQQDDDDTARLQFRKVLEVAGKHYVAFHMVLFAAQVAEYFQSRGDNQKATELAAFVTNCEKGFAYDRKQAESLLEKLKNTLDVETYNIACERGKALDLEIVVQQLNTEFGENDA